MARFGAIRYDEEVKVWFLLPILVLAGCGSGTPSASDGGANKPAAGPKFINIMMSDQKDGGAPMTRFKTDTAKIWLSFGLENVKKGSKIRAVWVCTKAPNIPANFEIADTTVEVGIIDNVVDFSLSRPNQGWPPGEYRVDLYLDGSPLEKVPFTIEMAG